MPTTHLTTLCPRLRRQMACGGKVPAPLSVRAAGREPLPATSRPLKRERAPPHGPRFVNTRFRGFCVYPTLVFRRHSRTKRPALLEPANRRPNPLGHRLTVFPIPRARPRWGCAGVVCQANWQKAGGGSPPERRPNRATFLREPCAGSREGAGEASVAVRTGRLLSTETTFVRGAEAFTSAEGNIAGIALVRCRRTPRCQRTHARPDAFCRDPGRSSNCPASRKRGRVGNGESPSL